MKITAITPILVTEWRNMLYVLVETDKGITGIGEAGLTSREFAVQGMIEHLKTLLIGKNAFAIEHHWQTMWRSGFHPAGQVLSSAIAAIDIALWDIKGKALGVPVYDLLGGPTRDKVLTYCHIHGATPEETLAQAKAKVAEGWKALRWEPTYQDDMCMRGNEAVEKAITEFALLRRELGPSIELCFDAHTKFTPAEALYFCRAVEQYRPFFIEDPLRCELPDAYSDFRTRTSVPIAAGEQYGSKWQFEPMLKNGLIDYCRIDLCIAGGITDAKKTAALCETYMVDLAVHNPIGPVSTAACLHLNMSIPNVLVQELPLRPNDYLAGVFSSDQSWDAGYLFSNGAPGIGVEVDVERLKAMPFQAQHLPILHREDGSFTNW